MTTSLTVGVVGAGAMGAGIAFTAARAGHRVLLHDARPGAAATAISSLHDQASKQVERGRLTEALAESIRSNLNACDSLDALAPAGLVVEAIVEDMAVKSELFRTIETLVDDDAILATNTSSFSVTALASSLRRPERFVGMHFFNPAIVMPLVEVVSGARTAGPVADDVVALAIAWGKTPVRCGSTPGFIVNRVARPFYGEALRLLEERVASPATIDAVVRECGGFRMGPFALMDLIGHDVNLAVTRSVYDSFHQDPRYKPSLAQQALVDAGLLGRKTGRGFYDYASDAEPPSSDDWPATVVRGVVTASPGSNLASLVDRLEAAGVEVRVGDALPGLTVGELYVDWTDGRSASDVALEVGRPTVLIDWMHDPTTAARIALAVSPGADPRPLIGALQAAGMAVNVIADAPGMIVARLFSMLANEAADVVMRGVGSGADVDVAMVAGANHPLGPVERTARIGTDRIRCLLDHLEDHYRDGRYRACPALRGRTEPPKPSDFSSEIHP